MFSTLQSSTFLCFTNFGVPPSQQHPFSSSHKRQAPDARMLLTLSTNMLHAICARHVVPQLLWAPVCGRPSLGRSITAPPAVQISMLLNIVTLRSQDDKLQRWLISERSPVSCSCFLHVSSHMAAPVFCKALSCSGAFRYDIKHSGGTSSIPVCKHTAVLPLSSAGGGMRFTHPAQSCTGMFHLAIDMINRTQVFAPRNIRLHPRADTSKLGSAKYEWGAHSSLLLSPFLSGRSFLTGVAPFSFRPHSIAFRGLQQPMPPNVRRCCAVQRVHRWSCC